MDPEIEDELETNADAPPSLRDTLSQALRQSNEEPAGDVEESAIEQPAEPAEGETQEQADQRARDAEGRFAKEKKKPVEKPVVTTKPVVKPAAVVKPGAKPAVAAAKPVPGAVPTSAPGAAAAAVEMKAPQAWRGPAKEVWASLPEAARVEVLRREKEITTQLTAFGEDRKYAQSMKQAFAPFEAHIAAEGSHPAQTIQRLMGTALALRTAPPAHKAALVADMITTFGVPLEGLVAALQGKAPPPGQEGQQQPQHVDPAAIVKQVREGLMKELGTQRETQLLAKSEAEVSAYLEKQPMHGLDGTDYSAEIRETMADLIDAAGKRKSTISLEKAYNLAARSHPEVSKVMAQKERAITATKANASTSRARVAASSVRHESATQPVGKADATSLRGALEAARDKHSER